MASTINASTTSTSGLVQTADASGVLQLQSNGITGLTVNTGGNISISTNLTVAGDVSSSRGLTTALVSRTTQTTTSGTAIDFTGIPSWVKRITIMFGGVSSNGTSVKQIQLGTNAGIQTTGYSCSSVGIGPTSVTTTSYTTGFAIRSVTAAEIINGTIVLTLLDSSTGIWTAMGVLTESSATGSWLTSGAKTLSGTLDRIRLTTVNGTDAFDAGAVNIMYE